MKYLTFFLTTLLLFSCEKDKRADKKETIVIDSLDVKTDTATVEVELLDFTAEKVHKMPDFGKIRDLNLKKEAFFCFLEPMVEEENDRLRSDRWRLLSMYKDFNNGQFLTDSDMVWLCDQASALRIKEFDLFDSLSRLAMEIKLDMVPKSMFLAQAANESAWGTSRFAQEANNLFGQWCFTSGCGLIPSQRKPGERNEVRKFETVNDAVKSYVTNINRHYAYSALRKLRYEERQQGHEPSGMVCAGGLLNYSIRREEYVKEIRAMIRKNNLE